MTYVENIGSTILNSSYYNVEKDEIIKDETVDESIFKSQDNSVMKPAPKEDEQEEKAGFFENMSNAIKSFFTGLFGKKETSKKDENNKAPIEEHTNKTNASNSKIQNNNEEEINSNIIKDTSCDKKIPEIVIQQYGKLTDDIYYNKNGEIVLAIKTSGAESMDVSFGELCGTFCDDNGEEYFAIVLEGSKKSYSNTKDGEIGDTKQGETIGDCWLLSTINSLSYTQKGREIIKEALEYQNDYTIVHLKGAKDYIITDDELETARLSDRYSKGDNDMIIFELAMEKAYKDIENGDVQMPFKAYDQTFNSISGGNEITAFEIIADKESKLYYKDTGIDNEIDSIDDEELKEYYTSIKASTAMEEFEANDNNDIAFTASIKQEGVRNTTDIYGNTINLDGRHSYAIKEVDGNKVIITDPHDSGENIVLSKQTAASIFDKYTLCDLSE